MNLDIWTKNEARESSEVVGDIYDKKHNKNLEGLHIPRANIPKKSVQLIYQEVVHKLQKHKIFDAKSLSTIVWVWSTRQYLEENYQKPYAGDLDILIEVPVAEDMLHEYIKEELIPKFEWAWIKLSYILGSFSLFFPIHHTQYDDLHVQVDIMFAPESKGSRIYKYMQDRYLSGDTYVLQDGYSLKWVHTNQLKENILLHEWYYMWKTWLYQKKRVNQKEMNGNKRKELLQTLGEKNRQLKKLRPNADIINNIIQGNELPWGKEYSHTTLFWHEQNLVYPEILELLINKKTTRKLHTVIYKEIFGVKEIRTFDHITDILQQKKIDGVYSEQEVQSLIRSYAKKLMSKNKWVLWTPYIKKLLDEKMSIDRTEIDELEQQKIEKKLEKK